MQIGLLLFSQFASQYKDSAVNRMLTLLVLFVALDRSADVSLSGALQQRLPHISCHHSLSLGAEVRVAAQHKIASSASLSPHADSKLNISQHNAITKA